MKLSEVQVGDKLHIEDDLFGSHKKVEVVEVHENGVLALNYRNKQITIQSDELTNYKRED